MGNLTTPPDEVAKIYDGASRMAGIFNDGHAHLAYWYDELDETPVREAAQRVTRRVVDALGLRRDERLLDAGCGVGGPAIQVAEETGAQVTGITISAGELSEAGKRLASSTVAGQVRFQQGDYQSLPHPDGSFDAIMAIESLTHAPDLGRALKEFHRVLRPGGRVAITDCTREARMSDPEVTELMDKFKTNLLLTIPEWLAALEAAGFVVEEYTQCGPRVYGMGMRYLDRANELHDTLASDFGEEMVKALKQGYHDYFGAGPDRMGYAILAARKPGA